MSKADIVNEWFRERLSGGALGRVTEAYSQVVMALPDLIKRLDAADKAAPGEPGSPAPAPTPAATKPAKPPTTEPSVADTTSGAASAADTKPPAP